MKNSGETVVLPGDRLAVIEEFEGGEGTYLSQGEVRSATVGRVHLDRERRIIEIKYHKGVRGLPKPGDTVIGQVESVQSSTINLKIYYVNGVASQGGFEGMLMLPHGRLQGRGRQRRPTLCKPGDVVRAMVESNVNAILHLSMDRDIDGVVYTVCSICGGSVTSIDGKVRCNECDAVEYRKLASDFGKFHQSRAWEK